MAEEVENVGQIASTQECVGYIEYTANTGDPSKANNSALFKGEVNVIRSYGKRQVRLMVRIWSITRRGDLARTSA